MKNSFSASSTQRYKYNGKELDRMHGLDLYDYGARLYDAPLGRWHTLDPLCEKYYSVSPYAYCLNNPVKFVDPDGRKIILAGNRQQRIISLALMQNLTNNKLGVMSNGEVIIMGGSKNNNKKLVVGTELIQSLVYHKKTTTVIPNSSNDFSEHPTGKSFFSSSDAIVNFDPQGHSKLLESDYQYHNVPISIGLGHELIHALHDMDGDKIPLDKEQEGPSVQSWPLKEKVSIEELRAVGLEGHTNGPTENKLRKEHGYRERIAY